MNHIYNHCSLLPNVSKPKMDPAGEVIVIRLLKAAAVKSHCCCLWVVRVSVSEKRRSSDKEKCDHLWKSPLNNNNTRTAMSVNLTQRCHGSLTIFSFLCQHGTTITWKMTLRSCSCTGGAWGRLWLLENGIRYKHILTQELNKKQTKTKQTWTRITSVANTDAWISFVCYHYQISTTEQIKQYEYTILIQ